MIQKPAEGTNIIPPLLVLEALNFQLIVLVLKILTFFNDEEFTDFAYDNGFNSRSLQIQFIKLL